MTATNWRTLRQVYQDKGIADVMATVPTMHAVLDMMEKLGVESATSGARTETEANAKLSGFYAKLYRPSLAELSKMINSTDEELSKPPPGFEDDDIEDSFDAFAAAVRAG